MTYLVTCLCVSGTLGTRQCYPAGPGTRVLGYPPVCLTLLLGRMTAAAQCSHSESRARALTRMIN
eukprot:315754-Rhodomonas_salina.1